MEETNDDVIPVNEEKSQQVYLGYVVTPNFVATNNEDFKALKDMVYFYFRYKKTAIQCRCNQITLNGLFSKDQKPFSVFTTNKKICT